MSKKKGQGSRINNSITLDQRYMLMKWCEQNKGDERTYSELAAQASADLGILITESCMQNHWISVNGPRRRRTEKNDNPETAQLRVDVQTIASCLYELIICLDAFDSSNDRMIKLEAIHHR